MIGKPTPGPYRLDEEGDLEGKENAAIALFYAQEDARHAADAGLTLEAFQVHAETGLTPRQIAVQNLHLEALLNKETTQLRVQRDELLRALTALVNARALAGVREQVAGWDGEHRPEGPHLERHPNNLGATLPKTNCGAIYALDEAMVAARAILAKTGDAG